MKKLIVLSLIIWSVFTLPAQIGEPVDYPNLLQSLLQAPTKTFESSLEKVIDSTLFRQVNQMGALPVKTQKLFLYDSLAREIRQLSYNFDIDTDDLLYILQNNTSYNDQQVIRSTGRFETGQWTNLDRSTETFRDDELLLETLDELWSESVDDFVPSKMTSRYYPINSQRLDSILTQRWDTTNQVWINELFTNYFYENSDAADSFYTYRWDVNTTNWVPGTKTINSYDANGNVSNLLIYFWDDSAADFLLTLDVREYYNGDELKDSTHVYSYFGGFYGENLSIFVYEDELLVRDTIYIWDDVNLRLKLANYQSYQYDTDDDLEEKTTFAYADNNTFLEVARENFYYSLVETPTALSSVEDLGSACQFPNPYSINSSIFCAFDNAPTSIKARLYDLNGRLHFEKSWPKHSEQIHFRINQAVPQGFYLLCLENAQGIIKRYKVSIMD